jgi:uncharacterized protein (TIGR03067 family)
MLRGPVVLLSTLVASIPAAAAEPAALLAGTTWTAESAERDGAPAPALVGHRLRFTGDRFEIAGADGRLIYTGTYTADATATPARIDFRNDGGDARGQTWEGIWRLDSGGTLTVVDDAPDPASDRPTDFAAPAGSGYVLLVFRGGPGG